MATSKGLNEFYEGRLAEAGDHEMRAIATRLYDLSCCTPILSALTAKALNRRTIDAVIVLPGLGEVERIDFGIELACTHGARALITTGTNADERRRDGDVDRAFVENRARNKLNERPSWIVEANPDGPNTAVQARNAIASVRRLRSLGMEIRSCFVVASAWHLLPRGYLTFVKQALILGEYVMALPYPVTYEPNSRPQAASEEHGTAYTDVLAAARAETMRCVQYGHDVAGYNDLCWYVSETGMFPTE